MPSIAADSSVLYAAFDITDRNHRRATGFLAGARATLVANLPVLTEVSHLLRKSRETQCAFLRFATSALDIDRETASDLPRIVEIMAKYSVRPADFADASLVAMCERQGIEAIVTLDKDFDVYQLDNGKQLRNVFRLD